MVPIIGMKAIARYKIYHLQKFNHIKNESMRVNNSPLVLIDAGDVTYTLNNMNTSEIPTANILN